MTEKEKMLKGLLYNPMDPELSALHAEAIRLADEYNRLPTKEEKARQEILRQLFPHAGEGLHIEGTVHADYGINTYMGKECFFNFDTVILDCCPVHIGDHLMAGPGTQIVTPVHPLLADERRIQDYEDGHYDLEYAKPIEIGNDVWLATRVIVCGGAKIGDGAVIGAGSVVLGEIPPRTFAAGIPAKVIRPLTDQDSVFKK
ncbi:MAG: sugar O-acetyltransferase [Candidatus Enteromonas sp.]